LFGGELATANQRLRNARVIVFSTPSCSWCTRVKQYLRQNQVRFKEIDVSKDEKAGKDMVRMSGQTGVPVTLVNNRPVVGFDKSKLDRLLDLS